MHVQVIDRKILPEVDERTNKFLELAVCLAALLASQWVPLSHKPWEGLEHRFI